MDGLIWRNQGAGLRMAQVREYMLLTGVSADPEKGPYFWEIVHVKSLIAPARWGYCDTEEEEARALAIANAVLDGV